MTFRSLTAFGFTVLAGCAVLPGAADDTFCLNCATADADASYVAFPDAGIDSPVGPFTAGARGSLCLGSCNPKNALATPDNVAACTSPADAGAPSTDGGGAGAELACRVVKTGNDPASAECVSAGSHGDGASCNSGADCAAGYECVGTPGACRHYCCDETECTKLGNSTNNPGRYFCDVQPETASPTTKVPVCMLAQSCDLLTTSCGDGMTCTLLDPASSEQTSCVSVGTAQAGDSCEVEHCAADMVCVGPIGQRKCQPLCDANHACAYPQQCDKQWYSLQKLGVGICQ